MAEITVAFALAGISHVHDDQRTEELLADLINFGFSKSGYSCLDKLNMFNSERSNIIKDPEKAVTLYNQIKGDLTAGVELVDGIKNLLADLRSMGVRTFTTSVVPQKELDLQMKTSRQGKDISPVLDEALGAQEKYKKLSGHLRYISKQYPNINSFYLLFDAPSEIEMGVIARNEFSSRIVGFALPQSEKHILDVLAKGWEIIQRIKTRPHEGTEQHLKLNPNEITIPTAEEIKEQLIGAGCDHVVIYRNKESLDEIWRDIDL